MDFLEIVRDHSYYLVPKDWQGHFFSIFYQVFFGRQVPVLLIRFFLINNPYTILSHYNPTVAQ